MGTIYRAFVESCNVHAGSPELWHLEASFYLPKEYDIAIAFGSVEREGSGPPPHRSPIADCDGPCGNVYDGRRYLVTLDEALAALRAQERERSIERVEEPSYGINGRAFIRWLREIAWHDWTGDAERRATQWRIWLFADQ